MTTEVNSRFSQISHLLLFVVILCPFASGKIIYVDDDAIGNNDGTSWENAYIFLQDALADAKSAIKRVEIRVAQGVYKPKLEVGNHISGTRITTSYLSRFQLINGVTLLGGYAGLTGPYPDIRDIGNYKTTLSGDLNGDDIDVSNPRDLFHEPTRSDNCSSIVIGSGTNRTAVLDGFIITGGFVRRHPAVIDAPTGRAGGMKNESGSPTINNCTFIGNSAESCGGGMLINAGSNPILTNCKFIKNYAKRGGGVDSGNSSPTFINCTFTNNYADDGAGMSVYYSETTQVTPIELIDCTFEDNDVKNFGGGLKIYSGDLILRNCVFIGNSASKGGGLYNNTGVLNSTNCQFIGNYAQEKGGGVAVSNSTLTECIFINNSSSGYGGGLAGNNSIYNCLISGNTAVNNGGAICGWGEVTNCTIVGNKTGRNGGGICSQGIVILTNNIIRDNKALIGNEIYASLYYKPARGPRPVITSSITVRYNNIKGGEEEIPIENDCILTWESGNINEYPIFVNPGYWADADDPNIVADPNDPNAVWIDGDYHLKSQPGRWDPTSESWVKDDVTSPCIDAGDPNSPIGHEPFPNGGIINMGAYGGTAEASKSPSGLHAKYGGGTGEPNNPYLIYTAEQMNTIGLHEQDWHKHFKLMADINLAGYSYNQALVAPDVDTDEYYFQGNPYVGIFDGNGHTISNLTITGVSYLGLFGELGFGSTVKDLGVVDVNINGTGDVAEGLLGHSRFGATIIRCYSTGKVNGDDNIGGLVGSNGGHMRQCYSSSTVSGNYIVGGLLGANEGGADATNCYSTDVVNGDDAVGGLVGFNLGEVTHCYSAGTVTGDQRIGGLVGWIYGSIVSSFWDIEASGQTIMCGSQEEGASGCDNSYGLTSDEMQTAGTFLDEGWDFVDETKNGTEDIWWILEGQDYPRLAWETE